MDMKGAGYDFKSDPELEDAFEIFMSRSAVRAKPFVVRSCRAV
jgi:hypothetical protein